MPDLGFITVPPWLRTGRGQRFGQDRPEGVDPPLQARDEASAAQPIEDSAIRRPCRPRSP